MFSTFTTSQDDLFTCNAEEGISKFGKRRNAYIRYYTILCSSTSFEFLTQNYEDGGNSNTGDIGENTVVLRECASLEFHLSSSDIAYSIGEYNIGSRKEPG